MESFLSGYSKGYAGSVGAGYTGGVSGAQTSGGASFNANGQNADISQLKPGDTFQGEITSVNGEDVQIQLANGQYLAAKLERDVQVALGQLLNLQVQSNKDNKVVLKPVADGNLQMLRVGEAALKAANMSVNEKNLQLVAKLIENGMPINKNTLMTYNRLALQNPKVPLSNIIELNKLKLPITEDNARQLENYRNMEHKILDGVKDAANELVKAYENIVNGAKGNMQGGTLGNVSGNTPNLPALENGVKFMEKVLSLVADEGAAAEAADGNNANKAGMAESNANKGAAAEGNVNNGADSGLKSENNINIAKNIDNMVDEGLKGDIKAENDVNIAKNGNNATNANNAKIGDNVNNVNTTSDASNPKTANNTNAAGDSSNPKTENNANTASDINKNNAAADSQANAGSRVPDKVGGNADMNGGGIMRGGNAAKAESNAKAESGSNVESNARAEGSGKSLTVLDNKTDMENAQRNLQKSDFTGSLKTDSGEVLTEKTHYLSKSATTYADANLLNNSVNAPKADIKGEQTKGETPKSVPDKIINYISSGKLDIKALHRLLTDSGIGKSLTPEQKSKIFDSEPFKRLLKDGLGKRWSLSPADIASEGKVEEFYSKLLKESNRFEKLINEAMHSAAGAPQTAATAHAKAMGNIAENVEFMNQMNQMFNYVQLPLKFGDSRAHGDLYVYTNKKNIARKDGMLTAFLHLDMDNLGPLDVSIALQTDKMQITTKFYLGEDSIKLVGEHMGELVGRLEKKGYKCKSMVLEKDEDKTVLEHIEEQVAAGNAVIGYRKFDTRA